jgi:hypothetical protein
MPGKGYGSFLGDGSVSGVHTAGKLSPGVVHQSESRKNLCDGDGEREPIPAGTSARKATVVSLPVTVAALLIKYISI